MIFAVIAYITLLAAYKLWPIRFLENIYRSEMYSHDSSMEILIGLSMIEFAFLHYFYTRGNQKIPSQPSYQNQDEPQTRKEPESTHCECCFFNWVKCDLESASERTLEHSLDSSSTWAVASHVSSLDLDGYTLLDDVLVELDTAEYLEDPDHEIHFSFKGPYGAIL
ncbi:unnamed protein product [Penicillium pancosmium]